MTEEERDRMFTEIHTTILGCNGTEGCWQREQRLAKDFYSFRFYIVVMILIAVLSGASGFTLGKLIEIMGR